ncbi:hypothetical protein RHGRI_034991 [Rhododendron griersonianum]|uniref:Uncharacterized protein n=1 Tax=Rhododendron griersonianum TaxID=479676 RepID=A0AAV6I5M7_9ERIC|nr:hypothetical protein RHGRI_034991 [Rhododendron griersonianum]
MDTSIVSYEQLPSSNSIKSPKNQQDPKPIAASNRENQRLSTFPVENIYIISISMASTQKSIHKAASATAEITHLEP